MEEFAAPSEGFLAALGTLTLNWAAIEAALDFATAIVFHEYPYSGMDQEVPQNLGRKIRLLGKGTKHSSLSAIAARAQALLSDISAHKDERHGIVHGAILGAPHGDTIQILRIGYEKTGHSSTIKDVTTAEIEGYAKIALALSDRTMAFAVRLYNITRPHDVIDYPLGEFAG